MINQDVVRALGIPPAAIEAIVARGQPTRITKGYRSTSGRRPRTTGRSSLDVGDRGSVPAESTGRDAMSRTHAILSNHLGGDSLLP
jgi:hypothetical protein